MRDAELETILLDPGVIRNRLKIYSVRKNAQVALEIQHEFGSLDAYFWSFHEGKTKVNHGHTIYDFPTEDTTSQLLSKDLKKRGMTFVGSTIMYAWMQAVGVVDDHIDGCFCKK
jgi:DNA-3-methyladenine glycosylase I